MNDEFRLTPVDIRQQEFRRSAFGYDRAAVEDFRERIATELERLLKERATLEERVQGLREQLKVFREREKALNDALVAAQQLRNDTEVVSRQQADVLMREARLKADQFVSEARESERQVRSDAEHAHRHFAAYLTAYRALLERSLAEVDALESHNRDGSPPPTP